MNQIIAIPLALAILAISACGASHNVPLSQVKDDDPVVQLNPDRWTSTVNDLITPPPVVPRIEPSHEAYNAQ